MARTMLDRTNAIMNVKPETNGKTILDDINSISIKELVFPMKKEMSLETSIMIFIQLIFI